MYLKLMLLAFFCLGCHYFADSQIIKGKVVSDGRPVAGATVSLLTGSDSSLLKIVATDNSGDFVFEAAGNSFFVRVSMVGFHKYSSDVFSLSPGKIDLPNVILEKETASLESVTVTASKPVFQYKGDKLIVNVDAVPSGAGLNLLEMLGKLPGVLIDTKGNITLQGKSGVMVMVDGKETYLSGEDLADLLRNMPASSSDQVELITNPSSRYDAATTGGIINIRSKRSLRMGLNGSFTIAPGMGLFKDRAMQLKTVTYVRNSVNWNYRKERVNFFGNLGYSLNEYNENFFERRFFYVDSRFEGSVVNDNFYFSPSRFYQLRAGLDFYANTKHLFGAIMSHSYSSNTSVSSTVSDIIDGTGNPVSSMLGTAENPGSHYFTGSYNVNYKYTDVKKGRELTADLDYIVYRNMANVDISSRFYDAAGNPAGNPLLLKQKTRYDFDVYVGKVDYIQQFGTWRMEAGLKSSFTRNTSRQAFLKASASVFTEDRSRSNTFLYTENVNAAYALLARKINRTDIQFGFRGEQTVGDGFQEANDSAFHRSRIDVFPSLVINLHPSDHYSIGIQYSRKLSRPSFRNLNPFIYITDSLYSYQGNPFLLPQFSHNLELTQLINNKININIAYTIYRKLITNLVQNDPRTKVTRTYIENFNSFNLFIASITVPLKLTEWWNASGEARLLANAYRGRLDGLPVRLRSSGGIFIVSSNFSVSQRYSADLNLDYTTPRLLGALIYFDHPFSYSFGVRRKFENNRGSLSLAINTPFSFPARKGTAAYGTTFFDQRAAFATQRYNISFNYRFGKITIESQRNKKNAAAEEQSRL